MKKTRILHMRVSEETYRKWRELLYYWKIFGWDADKLLSEMIAHFRSKPKGQVL
jgi:hypothetical protein